MKLSPVATKVMQLVKARIREDLTVASMEKPELGLSQRWNVCAPIVDRAITQAFEQAQETMLHELQVPLLMEQVSFPGPIHGHAEPFIHVHMVTNWNTLDYAYYAVQNLKEMAYDPSVLTTLYCLDERAYAFVRGSTQFCQLGVVPALLSSDDTGQGSEQHAWAIRRVLASLARDVHNVIADSDVVVFARSWDQVLREQLASNDMFGIGYDDIGECQYYQGLPSLSWIAFRQGLDLSGFDPMPQKDDHLHVTTVELSSLHGVVMGTRLTRDTGWRLPEFVRDHELKAVNLPVSRPSSVFGPDSPFTQYDWNGSPFLAHMARSIKSPFRTSQRSRLFYDGCERYFENYMQ